DFLNGAASGRRCDLPENLLARGCEVEVMERWETRVEVNTTVSGTQVSPRDISVTLRPGSEASIVVEVKQLHRYPVDLYYLVDVSASMQENLDHLKTVGVALTLRMTEHTSDLWLGFGSFVDKPVSPYINVHPSKISNPCSSDYEIRCRPAHGFHHVLSMTGNMSEFTRVIKRQRISGNMDTPEGGLDAMLQAAVCQVGTQHTNALMPDSSGACARLLALINHLVGVENEKWCRLSRHWIYSCSGVQPNQTVTFTGCACMRTDGAFIFGAACAAAVPAPLIHKIGRTSGPFFFFLRLSGFETYKPPYTLKLNCIFTVNNLSSMIEIPAKISPNTYFKITFGLRSCPDDGQDEHVNVLVRPVGYNESTVVRIHSKCGCGCGATKRCNDDSQTLCSGMQDSKKVSNPNLTDSDRGLNWSCRPEAADVDCSGRGVCECGRCVCDRTKVYGKYCEMDDFSCPYHGGLLCGGRGTCVLSECACADGWTGESCGCPVSTATCQSANGLLCSGRGRCTCGKCVCDDPQYSGEVCQRCPACQSTCQAHWKCVDCHLS
uniref:Integrin beta n=1 Tax=Tetraodon nigroviridis TaxID=99883 RepID=H3DQE2_TETNG